MLFTRNPYKKWHNKAKVKMKEWSSHKQKEMCDNIFLLNKVKLKREL